MITKLRLVRMELSNVHTNGSYGTYLIDIKYSSLGPSCGRTDMGCYITLCAIDIILCASQYFGHQTNK
jgi:hypothetical protein